MTTAPQRVSTSVRIAESLGTSLRSLAVGAMLFVPGAWFFYKEVNEAAPGQPLHTWHLVVAVGLMVSGGIAIQPPFGKQLTSIFVSVAPYLPLVGGKRGGDPPKPDA